MTPRALLITVALASALTACGDRDSRNAGQRPDGAQDPLLPTPQTAGIGVTGMPGAGPPGPRPGEVATVEPVGPLDENGVPLPPPVAAPSDAIDPGNPESGGAGEPGPGEAIAVIRDYYSAINAGSFANAYRLWADYGRASNQSPDAFEEGFAQIRGVSVEIGTPSPGGGTLTSRSIDVPVTLLVTERDDSIRRFTGAYTLTRMRPGVEGASEDEQQWRIASTSLVETR